MRITRREFAKLFTEGVTVLGILKLISLYGIPSEAQSGVVRPPSAVDEKYFNLLCVRCGICLEVCPTKTIVLSGFENGIAAFNTPKIDPSIGPCEFYRGRCEDVTLCSKFCPTGALKLVNKLEVKLGTVEFSQDKCLAYLGKECIVCSEMCPVPGSITLTEDLKPVFNGEKCVGCGICVNACPADPKALTLLSKGAKRAK